MKTAAPAAVFSCRHAVSPAIEPRMNLLLGIGNPRHGDDALGPVFARAFRHPHWRCINASTAPEHYTSLIRRLQPGRLLLLDAVLMDLPPGSIRRLEPGQLTAAHFGTHAPSLAQFIAYLSEDVPQIDMLGIQPQTLYPGARLSSPVRLALKQFAAMLAREPLDFTPYTPTAD